MKYSSWISGSSNLRPISAFNVRESPKFSRLLRNRGRGIRWWRQTGSGNTAVSRMRNKNMFRVLDYRPILFFLYDLHTVLR